MTANSSDLIYENDRITDGFDIFFWVFNDASSFVPSHWHRAIEMMYILDGEVDVIINAQETVLLSGDIFLIDSSVIHSTKSVHGNHAILIQLPYTLLKKYIAEFDDLNFAFDCHSDNPILHTKILQLIEVVKEMQIIFEVQPKGGILRFNSLVFEMLYQLYHNFSQPIPDTDLRKDEKHFDRLKLVMNYTNDHYNRPLSLDEIANVACFQKEYFCHF
ncbi:MAG: cupin domain-containing protein, partial [Lachnospiraceae bacterium]|nr:cupin domain-containing protein [Lachnospiraceae bacterium]